MADILDRGLNAAIVAMAARCFPKGFDPSPDAPSSFKALMAHMAEVEAGRARMLVYDGGSECTIYGDDEVNYAFRAWHDWTHWAHKLPFDLTGETLTWHRQVNHLILWYGDCPTVDRWSRILHAEIVGQALHYQIHGAYVGDQIGFVRCCLARGVKSALASDWS